MTTEHKSASTSGIATLRTEGRVAVVALDRPPVNALTVDGYRQLTAAFAAIADNPDVSVAVLHSALLNVFCAGADVKDLERNLAAENSAYDEERQAAADDLFRAILHCPVPVIGCVNRKALGAGAVMLACCDFRVASDRAEIGLTEINVGRCGGGRHLSRILPQGCVRRMYFTGQPLSASEAHRLGGFEEIVADGSEFGRAMELAQQIASKSPIAVRIGKEALDASEGKSVAEGYRLEQACTLRLGATEDAREALAAFREKRAPVWAGR
jgi:enoyl-CoA hydratase